MMLVDTRSSFLDSKGKPLSAGRLLFFKEDNTTELVGYSDKERTIPVGVSVRLMDAGWSPTVVYFKETALIHVQEYVGVDNEANDLFADVKTIVVDYIDAGTSNISAYREVDSIDELKEIVPTDGMSVFIKGFYEKGDAPSRCAIFDASSTDTPNNGTIISSNQSAIGNWFINQEGSQVDSRIFGVIPSATHYVVNSALANAASYCNSAGKSLYFSSGTYNLVSGGSYTIFCDIVAAKDVRIATPTLYTLTVQGKIDAVNTFAYTNVRLVLSGSKHYKQVYKDTIFNDVNDCSRGTGEFSLNVTANRTITTVGSKAFYNIIIDSSYQCNFNISTEHVVTINTVEGSGYLTWSNKAPVFKYLSTSRILNPTPLAGSGLFESVTDTLIVDQSFDTPSSGTLTCNAKLYVYEYLTINTKLIVNKILDGADKKLLCDTTSSGAIQYVGKELPSRLFANGDLLVNSFNTSSSVGYLDLLGLTAEDSIVTKSGNIRNGNIAGWYIPGGVCKGSNLTITTRSTAGQTLTCGYLILSNSIIDASGFTQTNSAILNVSASNLTNVEIKGPSAIGCFMSAYNSVWTEVAKGSGLLYFKSVGGAARLLRCSADYLMCIAKDNFFGNFYADGCAFTGNGLAGGVYFDPAGDTVDSTEKTCSNVTIRGTLLNGHSINSNVGTSAKRWAISGHTNINIYDNELAPSTKGSAIFQYTGTFSNASNLYGYGYLNPVLPNGKKAIFFFAKRENVPMASVNYTAGFSSNAVIVNPADKSLFVYYTTDPAIPEALFIGTKCIKEGNDATPTIPSSGNVSVAWSVYP